MKQRGGRKLSPKEKYPLPEAEEFLVYMATYRTTSRATISTHLHAVSLMLRWIVANHGITRASELTTEMVTEYLLQYAAQFTAVRLSIVKNCAKNFVEWLSKEGKGHPDLKFRMPEIANTEKTVTPSILLPDTIFRMRQVPGMQCRAAMAIEVLLSSGMRIGEFLQIRPCDICFDEGPVDTVTGLKSPCVGGTIHLKRELFRLKSDRSRIVYISVLAKRLLHQYMERMGIPSTSRNALFPFTTTTLCKDFEFLIPHVPELMPEARTSRKMIDPNGPEEYELTGTESPEYLRSLSKKVSRSNTFIGPIDPLANIDLIEKKTGLHPHKLRHCFTCFQYYRTYMGSINDLGRVATMLGHQGLGKIHIYLTQLDAIKSMNEWKRLWIGTSTDWSRMV